MIVSFQELCKKYDNFLGWFEYKCAEYCSMCNHYVPTEEVYQLIATDMGGEYILVRRCAMYGGTKVVDAVEIEEAALTLFLLRLL